MTVYYTYYYRMEPISTIKLVLEILVLPIHLAIIVLKSDPSSTTGLQLWRSSSSRRWASTTCRMRAPLTIFGNTSEKRRTSLNLEEDEEDEDDEDAKDYIEGVEEDEKDEHDEEEE